MKPVLRDSWLAGDEAGLFAIGLRKMGGYDGESECLAWVDL